MQMKTFVRLVVVLGLAIQLAACGFHLRGTGDVGQLAIKSVDIQPSSTTEQDLYRTLKRRFSAAGVETDVTNAQVIVELGTTVYKTSRTSTSGLGDVTSQLLRMSQNYVVIDAVSGEKLVTATAQSLRDRRIKSTDILAAESELRGIKQIMRDEIAKQILRTIQNSEFKLNSENQGNSSAK